MEFLRRWEIECEDRGYDNLNPLIDYCECDIRSVIELLDEYINKNWDGLKKNLKDQHWQLDIQKSTMTNLN